MGQSLAVLKEQDHSRSFRPNRYGQGPACPGLHSQTIDRFIDISPRKNLGKEFWDRVYSKARQMYGTSDIPVNTFNKVWIMADSRPSVFKHNQYRLCR